jgi:DNA-binding MarR family transcriptional regulator
MKQMQHAISLQRFFPFLLSRVANTVSNGTAQLVDERFGLALREARLMVVLGALGQATAAELGAVTVMDRAPVSRALSNLVVAGLISRTQDPLDARRLELQLTPKGQEIHAALVPELLHRERQLLSGLDATERQQLLTLLAKLGRQLAAFPQA